jgi:hypothetical protein
LGQSVAGHFFALMRIGSATLSGWHQYRER